MIDLRTIDSIFPPGTPVCVGETVPRRNRDTRTEVVGVVESWESLPTGSWFAQGKGDKLWLPRLKLRKHDGELTLIVVDDATQIARLVPSQAN